MIASVYRRLFINPVLLRLFVHLCHVSFRIVRINRIRPIESCVRGIVLYFVSKLCLVTVVVVNYATVERFDGLMISTSQ